MWIAYNQSDAWMYSLKWKIECDGERNVKVCKKTPCEDPMRKSQKEI